MSKNIGFLLFLIAIIAALAHFLFTTIAGAPPVGMQEDVTDVKLYVQLTISAVLGAASLWVILSKKYADDTLKWAFGAVGIIVGFWLK